MFSLMSSLMNAVSRHFGMSMSRLHLLSVGVLHELALSLELKNLSDKLQINLGECSDLNGRLVAGVDAVRKFLFH